LEQEQLVQTFVLYGMLISNKRGQVIANGGEKTESTYRKVFGTQEF
jgi:hypothetical protein